MAKAKFFGTNTGYVGFVEKDFGNRFNCYSSEECEFPSWALAEGLTHRFQCRDNSYRYLTIARTFANVAVDEDENGIVFEKWKIRVDHHREVDFKFS